MFSDPADVAKVMAKPTTQLYTLILERTLATVMQDTLLNLTTATFTAKLDPSVETSVELRRDIETREAAINITAQRIEQAELDAPTATFRASGKAVPPHHLTAPPPHHPATPSPRHPTIRQNRRLPGLPCGLPIPQRAQDHACWGWQSR